MELESKIRKLAKISTELNNEKTLSEIKYLSEKLNTDEFKVCFTGETTSGKSTIINSLIGDYVLKTGSEPTNFNVIEVRVETELKYGIRENNDEITRQDFLNLSTTYVPDKTPFVVVPANDSLLKGYQLYDTPGFNSLFEEHEEILVEFIDNADVLIYVINYKTGFSKSDMDFCNLINCVFDDEMENTVFIINRIPSAIDRDSDLRLNEIKTKIEKHFAIKPNVLESKIARVDHENEERILIVPGLKEEFEKIFSVDERRKRVRETISRLLKEYAKNIKTRLKVMINSLEISEENHDFADKCIRELEKTLPVARKKISVTKKCIKKDNEIFVEALNEQIKKEAEGYLDKSCSLTDFESGKLYLKETLVPRIFQQIQQKIYENIKRRKIELDLELEGLINTAVENSLNLPNLEDTNLKRTFESLMEETTSYFLRGGGMSFLAKFGGSGGSGAGFANFAKKALKLAGKPFGKKFSAVTHNKLAVLIKKMGLTSTKKLNVFLASLIEILVCLCKAWRYKSSVRKKINGATEEFSESILDEVNGYMDEWAQQEFEEFKETINELKQPFIDTKGEEYEAVEQKKIYTKMLKELKNTYEV